MVDDTIHVRRCHKCGGVTEKAGASVDRCEHCGKPIAPFYFFDDFQVEAFADNGLRPGREFTQPGQAATERCPLLGFSAIW